MAAPGSQMKRCPTCGAVNVIAAQVCSACGHTFRTQFGSTEIVEAVLVDESDPTQTSSPNVIDADYRDRTPKRWHSWALMAIAVVAIMSFSAFMVSREQRPVKPPHPLSEIEYGMTVQEVDEILGRPSSIWPAERVVSSPRGTTPTTPGSIIAFYPSGTIEFKDYRVIQVKYR